MDWCGISEIAARDAFIVRRRDRLGQRSCDLHQLVDRPTADCDDVGEGSGVASP